MLTARQALLHRLTQERATVLQAIEFMPEEELVRRPVFGDWSAKDVLGHLASWEEEFIGRIERFARGEPPASLGVSLHDWNGQQARRKWDWTLAQVMENLIATRRRLLALVVSLSDEVFSRPGPPPYRDESYVPSILNAIATHDRKHWDDLMAYKEHWIARQAQAAA